MADGHVEVEERGIAARGGAIVEYWRPLAWSAIVGGMVTALGIQVILTLFGIGLGAAVMDPLNDPTPTPEFGAGALIWLVVSGIISFGVGGWVAGHMSGVLRTGSGSLHGVVAWALAAVFGATVTALAGAPVLGGAAAGVGAATRGDGPSALMAPSGVRTTTLADGSVRFSDAYGRQVTEAEARVAAEEARAATVKIAMCTGASFLISMAAAGVGGLLGRSSFEGVVKAQTGRPVVGQLKPAH